MRLTDLRPQAEAVPTILIGAIGMVVVGFLSVVVTGVVESWPVVVAVLAGVPLIWVMRAAVGAAVAALEWRAEQERRTAIVAALWAGLLGAAAVEALNQLGGGYAVGGVVAETLRSVWSVLMTVLICTLGAAGYPARARPQRVR